MRIDSTLVRSTATKRILKTLSIFGSVQVLHILCAVIRTKLAAIWIGPLGVGLVTIYHSTMDFMSSTTQLNLRQSAVRDLSLAKDDPVKIEQTAALVRRLAMFLGVFGFLLVIVTSPVLGWIQFGDFNHTVPFLLLSVIMIFSAIAQGEFAIMQGCDRLKQLARATLYSSVTSSLLSLPLFYFFRLNGVIPVLILFAFCNLFYSLIFSGRKLSNARHRIKESRRTVSQIWQRFRDDVRQGRGMLALGAYMTVSSAVTLLASYIFIAYLNRTQSTDTVGYYQAGYTLINSYIGLIFTSISMEYFPRLSSIIRHERRVEVIVSHEIKIILSVLAPVVVAFICAKELLVHILYSHSFDTVIPYISIAIVGTVFRAVSWSLAFVMPAKGDGRIYVITETSSSALYLLLNIPLYNAFGFAGLGAAYVV
ncbi:MAG: oligosaccharide flippase family protein, partial [Muribaculaceae bacterium]|nr:oligosaccharide flippase family protein [Muribaculaceae bacterium]